MVFQAGITPRWKLPIQTSTTDAARLEGRTTTHGNLTVQKLDDIADLAALIPEWTAIDGAARPRSPFTSPAWLLPWWNHFQRRNIIIRDEFFSHAVRNRDGQLVAIAPLMRSFMPGIGLPMLRILQFFGNDPSLTEFRGVICRHDDHDEVIRTLFAHFLARRHEWDVFRIHGLRRGAADYTATLPAGSLTGRRELPDYVLPLPPSWEVLKARVSSNMRKNLRKAYETLERDGVRFGMRVIEAETEVAAAISRFLALHTARAAAADMVTHPHKFHTAHARAFLSECLLRMASRHQLRIFELEVDGAVVASRLAFLFEDVLYLYFAGYDPAWRQYSVMTVLMAELIQWALGNGVREINLSTGNDQSKLRWRPEEILLYEAVLISPARRGKMAFQAYRAYQRAANLRTKLRP